MPKQVEVLVEDISKDDNGLPTELTGTTRILTYKSFNYLNANPENPRFKLIGEVDVLGNLVPGNPNLNAQHRQAISQKSVVPVANDPGPSERERELLAEIAKLRAQQPQAPVDVSEKPVNKGGRPKKLNSLAEVS